MHDYGCRCQFKTPEIRQEVRTWTLACRLFAVLLVAVAIVPPAAERLHVTQGTDHVTCICRLAVWWRELENQFATKSRSGTKTYLEHITSAVRRGTLWTELSQNGTMEPCFLINYPSTSPYTQCHALNYGHLTIFQSFFPFLILSAWPPTAPPDLVLGGTTPQIKRIGPLKAMAILIGWPLNVVSVFPQKITSGQAWAVVAK